jgi:hypothetical protein
MPTPVEVMKPWAIKSMSSAVIDDIGETARREGLTAGQMVERAWAAYRAGAATQPMSAVDAATSIADMATLLHAVAALAAHTTVPRDVRGLISAYARAVRGLPGETTRKTQGVEMAALQAHDSGASITNP